MAITTTMRTQVTQLYVSLFGRAPEGEGLGYWVGQLDAGKTFAQVAQSMYDVTAARAYYPSFYTNQEIVGQFYKNVLGRTADDAGLAYWTAQMNTKTKGQVVADMIVAVTSYTGTDAAALASQSLFNNKVAVGQYYGENGGTDTTNKILATVTATTDVAAAKAAVLAVINPPAVDTTPTYSITTSAASVAEGGTPVTLKLVTTNVPDGTGVPYVVAGTGSAAGVTMAGEFTVRGNVAVAVVSVPTNSTYGDTGSFTVSLANGKGGSPSVTVTDSTAAPAVVNQTITLTSASEAKAGGAGNDTFLALNSGDLSNGDNIDGAGGSDTIYVVLTTGDGTVTLRPVLTSVETVQLELTEVAAGSTAGDTTLLNLDKSTGVTTVSVKNYTFATDADTVQVSGVTTATSLKITDDSGAASGRTNNYTMTYDGVSGTADSASVEISSTSAATALGNITEAGIENLTISSTGGANASYNVVAAAGKTLTLNASAASGGSVDLKAAAATTLNINAADSMTITDAGAASAALRTVNIDSQTSGKTVTLTTLTPTATAATADTFTVNVKGAGKAVISVDSDFGTQASTNADSFIVAGAANSGGITVDLSAFTTNAPQNLSVTAGSGNDTVTVSAGGLDKYDTIALGDGTDRLSTTASYSSNAAANLFYTDSTAAALLPAISGVEIASVALRSSATASTVDATSAAFASTLELTGSTSSGAATINNIAAGQKIALGSSTTQYLNGAAVVLSVANATTNTADVLNITSNLVNSTATATISGITAAKIETVTVDLASSTTANTTIAGGTLTFADATSVSLTGAKITSATVAAKTGATIDASGMTGVTTLTVDNAAKNYTIKGSATKATTFVMGGTLDNGDIITGGSATTDKIQASINGLTTTTGALNITGVETIQLDAVTAASTVNAAGIVGATSIALDGSVNVTLTNLASGVAVTLGNTPTGGSATAYTGTVSIGLAAAGNQTVNLTGIGSALLASVATTKVNALTLAGAADMAVQNLDVSAVTASSLVVTGGNTTTAVALSLAGGSVTAGTAGTSKLNALTTSLDASAYNGGVIAIAATNTPTTFIAQAPSTFTGSALNDAFTLGTTAAFIGASVGTIDGSTGTDSLTAYVKGSGDLTGVTNVETVNIVASGTAADYTSNAYSVTAAGGTPGSSPTGIQIATTTNISGGLAGTTVTLSGSIGDNGARTIDASADLGSINITFGDAGLVQSNLSDAIVIKGGQGSTDVVNVTAAGNNSNLDTGEFTMSGVEKLILTSGYDTTNASGANTVNLKNVTGLTTVGVLSGSSSDTASFTNVPAGVAFEIGQGTSAMTDNVTIGLATSSGASDAMTVKLIATASGTPTITTSGVEILNLALDDSTQDHSISLANTNTNAATLNVSGVNTSADLTLNSLASAYTTVSATGLKGSLILDNSAIGSGVYTITGGDGADTIGMKNVSSVLDGGAGSDTLNISYSGTGGALIIDLSSTVDQVQMFNGLTNAAVQKNFENVNASAYVQTNSVGADITDSSAANVITGTAYADTIRLTSGGSDTVKFASTAAANGSDSIIGFKLGATASGGDVIGNLAAGFVGTTLDLTITTAGDSLGLDAHAAVKTLTGVNVAQIFTTAAATFGDANVDAAGSTTIDHIILGNSQKLVLVAQTASTATTAYVYFITAGSTAGTNDVVNLVGTITLDAAGTWSTVNFV